MLKLSLAALALAALTGGGLPAAAAPSPDVQAVGAAGSDFGFHLLHLLATDHTDGPNANVFFSPFSAEAGHKCRIAGAVADRRDRRTLARRDAADFDRMTSRRTKLGAVLHVATLDVDEQGTVAAAVTGVVAVAGAVPTEPPPPVMRADRPFLVLIRDTETGSLLFAGVIRDPQ